MKTKMKYTIVLAQLLCSSLAFAQSGSHGGDPCESRFRKITQQLADFLNRGGADQLKYPSGWNANQYKSAMLAVMTPYLNKEAGSSVVMSCVSQPVYVNSVEKMCRWTDATVFNPKKSIECYDRKYYFDGFNQGVDQSRFEPEIFKQTIHEWSSIVGVEPNTGGMSDYFVSDQITSTGDYVLEFQIGIKQPSQPNPNPGSGIQYQGISVNPDGSVAVTGISISRGNQTFPIDYRETDGGFTTVCKVLGYDDSLEGPAFNQFNNKSLMAIILNADGTFKKYALPAAAWPITKVTCYKRSELKFIVEFKKEGVNLDGSVLLNEIWIYRGDAKLPIDYRQTVESFTTVCKVLGYDDNLEGPGFNQFNNKRLMAIILNADGTFKKYALPAAAWPITKVTCRVGKEPLVILVGGDVYRRILPAL